MDKLDLELSSPEAPKPTNHKLKQFTVRMDFDVFQNFIRIFPGHGDRQIFVRAVIKEVIRQVNCNPELMNLPEAVKKSLEMPSLKIRMKEGK